MTQISWTSFMRIDITLHNMQRLLTPDTPGNFGLPFMNLAWDKYTHIFCTCNCLSSVHAQLLLGWLPTIFPLFWQGVIIVESLFSQHQRRGACDLTRSQHHHIKVISIDKVHTFLSQQFGKIPKLQIFQMLRQFTYCTIRKKFKNLPVLD